VTEILTPSAGLHQFFETRTGRAALSAIAGYFHATLQGGEHIPRSGGALIVSNHALFALDAAVLGALLIRVFHSETRFV
jgi:1-acyl-sn-glycerol-3-phosphate acyltransferase